MAPVSKSSSIDHIKVTAYERVSMGDLGGRCPQTFLYVLHFENANYLQLGVGYESTSGLQKSHLPGAPVHAAHVLELVETMRASGAVQADPGRFAPLFGDPRVEGVVVDRFAAAVARVHTQAFGHPLDWEVVHAELLDGRFAWLAYDQELDKIRIGMGHHDASNNKVYGEHAYATGAMQSAEFACKLAADDKPLRMMGMHSSYMAAGMSPVLGEDEKATLAVHLIRLADRVWPGRVQLPASR